MPKKPAWVTSRKSKRHLRSARKSRVVIGIVGFCFVAMLIAEGIYVFRLFTTPIVSPIPQAAAQKKSKNSPIPIAKDIEQLLTDKDIRYVSIESSGGATVAVSIEDNGQALLSLKKPLDPQVSSLQLIISRLTIEGKRFDRLDFRYESPVIVLR